MTKIFPIPVNLIEIHRCCSVTTRQESQGSQGKNRWKIQHGAPGKVKDEKEIKEKGQEKLRQEPCRS